jgi:hypothetical protein
MIHHDETPVDRVQEDRTVEYLRSQGVFSGRAARTSADVTPLPPPATMPNKWRVTMIAAAAAVLLAFISVLVDRPPQSADEPPAPNSTPKLLVWY